MVANELAILIEKLKERQGNLSTVAWAKKLGVSRQELAIVMSGQHEPGQKFTGAVMDTYPDLIFEVVNYIKYKAKSRA